MLRIRHWCARALTSRIVATRCSLLLHDLCGTTLVLLAPNLFERKVVPLPETKTGVKGIQGEDRNDDHDAFEPDEQALVLDQSARPSLAELGDTVDGPDEDAQRGEGQREEEKLEGRARSQLGVRRVQRIRTQGLVSSHRFDGKVDTETNEDQKSADLESQAGNHDVVAVVGTFVLMAGDAGHCASDGLEEERDHVTRDEDARVGEGSDARVLGTKGADDAGECEVETGGHEGGSDGETAYLYQEAVLGKLVSGDRSSTVRKEDERRTWLKGFS